MNINLSSLFLPSTVNPTPGTERFYFIPGLFFNISIQLSMPVPVWADRALRLLRRHKLGKGSRVIGTITAENPGRVVMATKTGSERIVMPPVGEILPRIC